MVLAYQRKNEDPPTRGIKLRKGESGRVAHAGREVNIIQTQIFSIAI